MKKLIRAWTFLEQSLIPNIATVFFGLSFCWMLMESLSRRIFSYSFTISEEVVLFSLMWGILLCLATAGRNGYHIWIDLVFNYLPKSVQKGLAIVTLGLSFFYCLVILISSAQVIPHLKSMKLVSYTPLEFPMWIVNLSIPIGALLLCCFYFECFLREILGRGQEKRTIGH